MQKRATICVAQAGYYAIMTLLLALVFTLVGVIFGAALIVKRVRMQAKLSGVTGVSSPFFGVGGEDGQSSKQYHLTAAPPKHRVHPNAARVVDDMTEPIYTDPSLFEVSRSLTNLTEQGSSK